MMNIIETAQWYISVKPEFYSHIYDDIDPIIRVHGTFFSTHVFISALPWEWNKPCDQMFRTIGYYRNVAEMEKKNPRGDLIPNHL